MAVIISRLATENPFKAGLLQHKRQLGIWSSLCNNLLAEIMGDAGLDWILFDTEHAPNDLMSLVTQLQAIRGTPTQAVVRPASNDAARIKHLIDIGFRNFLIPFVQNAVEAESAVAATRYPPRGIRGMSAFHRNNGYGRIGDYFDFIDDVVAVIAQVESKEAVAELEAIARTPGIDAIFVGPGDLAASLGRLGRPAHPEVQDAIRSIACTATNLGIPAGIVAGSAADAERYLSWGFTFITVGSDIGVFRTGVQGIASAIAECREPAKGVIAKP